MKEKYLINMKFNTCAKTWKIQNFISPTILNFRKKNVHAFFFTNMLYNNRDKISKNVIYLRKNK